MHLIGNGVPELDFNRLRQFRDNLSLTLSRVVGRGRIPSRAAAGHRQGHHQRQEQTGNLFHFVFLLRLFPFVFYAFRLEPHSVKPALIP